MTVERHEFRKRNTTSTVSSAPSIERLLDVAHRVLDALAGVAHHSSFVPGGSVFCELVDLRAGSPSLTVRRAVALRLHDVDADRLLAVEERRRARLLGAVVDVGDLAEPDELAVALRRRRAARSPPACSRRPSRRIDAARRACPSTLADRRREVLRPQRLHHLRRRSTPAACEIAPDAARRSARAVDLADDVHLGDAGDRAQLAAIAGIGDARQLAAPSASAT